jgi:hypothetical protein
MFSLQKRLTLNSTCMKYVLTQVASVHHHKERPDPSTFFGFRRRNKAQRSMKPVGFVVFMIRMERGFLTDFESLFFCLKSGANCC